VEPLPGEGQNFLLGQQDWPKELEELLLVKSGSKVNWGEPVGLG